MRLSQRDLPRGYRNTFSGIIPQRSKSFTLEHAVRLAKLTSVKNVEALKVMRENLFKGR